MDIEGIVLGKTKIKESDLIVNLLLRSGKKQSVYIYGGAGGGRKNRGSVFELGYLVQGNILQNKKYNHQTITMSKSQIQWKHDNIRKNFKTFYSLNFVLELVKKIAVDEDIELSNDHDQELFSVLSNTIYQLNQESLKSQVNILSIFLQRIINYTGTLPNLDQCIICGENIERKEKTSLVLSEGGFSHLTCSNGRVSDQGVRNLLIDLCQTRFQDINSLEQIEFSQLHEMFSYFCYQLDMDQNGFQTWSFLGKTL